MGRVTFGKGSGVVAFENVGPDVAGDDLRVSGQTTFTGVEMEGEGDVTALRCEGGTLTVVTLTLCMGRESARKMQGVWVLTDPSGAISTLSVFAQWAKAAFVAL